MKRGTFLILIFILMLSGCSGYQEGMEKVTRAEFAAVKEFLAEKYGEDFGWSLKKGRKRIDKILELEYTEYHEQNEWSGLDLTPFANQNLTVYVFDLKPMCRSGADVYRFNLVVYQNGEEFVGDIINVKEVDGGPLETAGTADIFEVMNCK